MKPSPAEESAVLEVRNPCEMRSTDEGPAPNETPGSDEVAGTDEAPASKHAGPTPEPAVEPPHVPATAVPTTASVPRVSCDGEHQDHQQCQSSAAQRGELACHGP